MMDTLATLGASPWGAAAQLAEAIARRGAKITLRCQAKTAGAVILNNPPRVVGATVKGGHPAGSATVALAATTATGHLLPGDMLTINGVAMMVVAEAVAQPPGSKPGFAGVPVAPLSAPLPDGTPVGFSFRADIPTFGMIDTFPARLVDGERIQARDLSVVISAYNIPEVQTTWLVLVRGREMSVVTASPNFERNEIVSWNLQAR